MKYLLLLPATLTVWLSGANAFAGTPATTIASDAVVPAPPTPTVDDWRVSLGMPLWLAGLKGDMGVGGLPPQHADVPFTKILEHLDMVAALNLEVDRGPWGIYADGLYMKVSAGTPTPGPLLHSIQLTLQQEIGEIGVTYRVWKGQDGYFDLLAGARYMGVQGRINLNSNSAGIKSVSDKLASSIVDQVSAEVKSRASDALAQAKVALVSKASALKANAIDAIQAEAASRIQSQVGAILAKYPNLPGVIKGIAGRDGPISDALQNLVAAKIAATQADISEAQAALNAQKQAIGAAARAALNAKIENLKAKANKAVEEAEQELADRIESAIYDAMPQEATGSQGWVDPFVGFRARYNFNERIYATVRGDIGGFGISSKLAWKAFGAFGYQMSEHWSSELGYLYYSDNYQNGGFVFNAAMRGAYLGLTYTF